MIRYILSLFGYELKYICDWGTYNFRYDSIDYAMGRPVHGQMSVAPPWAKLKIVRREL